MYRERLHGVWPVMALIALAPLIGVLTAVSPVVGGGAALCLVAALAALCVRGETAVRRVALALCAVIIAYPAFMPRRAAGFTAVADGGDFGARAMAQLAVVAGIAAIGVWLWFTTPGTARALLRSPLNLFVIYAFAIIVSLTYTPDVQWAAYAALRLLEAFVIINVLAVLVRTPQQLARVLDVMLLACVMVMAVYLSDIATGAAVGRLSARVPSNWIHPNSMSTLCFTFVAIVTGRFFTATTPRSTRITAGLMGLGAFTGLMTAGKTGLIAGAVGIVLAMFIAFARKPSQQLTARITFLSVGLSVIVMVIILQNVGIAAHLQSYDERYGEDASLLTGRVPLWQVVIEKGMEHPLRGHGYMSTFESNLDNGQFWVAPQAHNAWLQSFFDLGLIGAIIVAAIYISALGSVIRQAITLPVTDPRWSISLQLLAALIALTINSFTEDIFGGLFEIRTMLFVLVVFAIFQNTRVRAESAGVGQAGAPGYAQQPALNQVSRRASERTSVTPTNRGN